MPEVDQTLFEMIAEDGASRPLQEIARAQDELKFHTKDLQETWDGAFEQMETVSSQALKKYQFNARHASEVQKVLVTDMNDLSQSFVELGRPIQRGADGLFHYSGASREAAMGSQELAGLIRILPQHLDTLVLRLVRGSSAIQTLATGASVLGAAIGGWQLGRWIDGTLGLGDALKQVGNTAREANDAAAATAEGQELLRAINEKLGTSYTDLVEAETAHRKAMLEIHAAQQKATISAKELNEETKRMRAERADALTSAKDIFQTVTGGDLFEAESISDQFAALAPGLKTLFSDSFALGAEDRRKLVDGLAKMAAEAGLKSGTEFISAMASTPLDQGIVVAVAAQVDEASERLTLSLRTEATDALIASMDAEDAQKAAERLGQTAGEKIGEGVTEGIASSREKVEKLIAGSIEAIVAQAATVRQRVTDISGGDIAGAPEQIRILTELLRREGSQEFTGGSSRRLSRGELAGLENLAAGGDLEQIEDALAVLQEQRAAFRSGRVTGGSRSAQTFARENIDLQIRFLQRLVELVEALQDQFPPGPQTVELSQLSVAQLARELNRPGTFR